MNYFFVLLTDFILKRYHPTYICMCNQNSISYYNSFKNHFMIACPFLKMKEKILNQNLTLKAVDLQGGMTEHNTDGD